MKSTSNCAIALILIITTGCGGSSSGGTGTTGGGGGGTSTSTTVTFTFQGPAPTAVAAKIGSGSFAAQTLSSGILKLSLPIGTTNFAVAFACPTVGTVANGAFPVTGQSVLEATTADGTAFTAGCRPPWYSGQTGALTGTIDASAIPGVTYAEVDALNGQTLIPTGNAPISGDFTLSAAAGSNRVEMLAYQNTGQTFLLAAARNFASQAVPGTLNSGNTVVLGASDETTLQPISYVNVPSGYAAPITDVTYDMGYIDPHFNWGGFRVATLATTQYPTLPASAVESGDFYYFYARTYNSGGPGEMTVDKTSTNGGAVSFTFPTPWSYDGPTPAALPTLDFVYAGFSGTSGIVQEANLGWAQGGVQQYFTMAASANYQHGSTTLAFPDLSGLTGFLPTPASGTQLTWGAGISQSSGGVFQPMASNASIVTVSNSGNYAVP